MEYFEKYFPREKLETSVPEKRSPEENSPANILIKMDAQRRGIAWDAARRAGFRGTKESIKKSLAVVGIAQRIKRKFFPPEVLPFSP